MVCASVIPDCHVVDVFPLESDLQVMVLHDKTSEPVEKVLALGFTEPMNALSVLANCEDRLPTRDRVRADNGVDCLQRIAFVLWCATFCTVYVEVVVLGSVGEHRLSIFGC